MAVREMTVVRMNMHVWTWRWSGDMVCASLRLLVDVPVGAPDTFLFLGVWYGIREGQDPSGGEDHGCA